MTKKYYVIWKGAQTGVFDDWSTVQAHTSGRSDAQFMGFTSKTEAQAAFKGTYTQALMKRSLSQPSENKASVGYQSKNKNQDSTAPSSAKQVDVQIYSDGACSPNPGKSGTGMAVYIKGKITELWYGLHQPMGTNNTAELNGMRVAFRYARNLINQGKSVEVLSDSKYSIDCITKWAKSWQAKGWKRGKNEEIKNLEIIQECFSLYNELKKNITITYVKGHANIEGNELADRMAVLARMEAEPKFVRYQGTINIKDILAMPSG